MSCIVQWVMWWKVFHKLMEESEGCRHVIGSWYFGKKHAADVIESDGCDLKEFCNNIAFVI